MDAVKFYVYAMMSASEELKQDRDLWLRCLDDGDGGCLWDECPQSLKEDWDFVVEYCRCMEWISDTDGNFGSFSKPDLEAEVLKRGGPLSGHQPWEGANSIYD